MNKLTESRIWKGLGAGVFGFSLVDLVQSCFTGHAISSYLNPELSMSNYFLLDLTLLVASAGVYLQGSKMKHDYFYGERK